MGDSYDGIDYGVKTIRVAMPCMSMAGRRDNRELNLLFFIAQETYLRDCDRARLSMRQLVLGAQVSLNSLNGALDLLKRDRLSIRDREPGATGASVYSIALSRLIEAALPHQNEFCALPVRKRNRRAA